MEEPTRDENETAHLGEGSDGASDGEEIADNREDSECENYSGYTEEELAFMQRLQKNRNTSTHEAASPAEALPQVCRRLCCTF